MSLLMVSEEIPGSGGVVPLLACSGHEWQTRLRTGRTRALDKLPGASRSFLAGYDAPAWADVVADRGSEISQCIEAQLGAVAPLSRLSGVQVFEHGAWHTWPLAFQGAARV